jgi:hypothetical protein
MFGETSGWEMATAGGTISAAVFTALAVLAALHISRREHSSTKDSLAISRRLLEAAEVDRREGRRAIIVVEWAVVHMPPGTNVGPLGKTFDFVLRIRNDGPGLALDVKVKSQEGMELGDLGETGPSTEVSVALLASGRSIMPLRSYPSFGAPPETVLVSWSDGDGPHTETQAVAVSRDG